MAEADLVSLREYIERLIAAARQYEDQRWEDQRRLDEQATHAHTALHSAADDVRAADKEGVNARLEALNQVRPQLDRMQATFPTIESVEVRFRALQERMEAADSGLEVRMEAQTKTNQERIAALERTAALGAGGRGGSAATIGYIIQAVVVLIALAAVLVAVLKP